MAILLFAFVHLTASDLAFEKVVLDHRFVAEGVTVGDVNRDGKRDVLAGSFWYEAPSWKAHQIASYREVDLKQEYSDCFHCWADDLNHDGWIDQVVIGMPGEKAIWRENPKGSKAIWKEHLIWRSAGNESPHYEDLLGNGKRVLVMGTDDEYVAWFEPSKDPYAEWVCHRISALKGSGSQRYSHGLGIGDVNRDGRRDVVTTAGVYLAPKDRKTSPWEFLKADLGPDCAHMCVLDGTVLSSSAHARGVWWHRREAEGDFGKTVIDETVSVTHAAKLVRIGESWNLITGKRKWGHPPGVDVGSDEPAWVMRYEKRGDEWERHVIDEDSGVGTQIAVEDLNGDGLLDIVTANKNGVFLFRQKRV